MNFCDWFTDRNTQNSIHNSNYYTCHSFHPFTSELPPTLPATPHLPYHLSLSDLQLLLVLTINIPSSISPRSVKKISLWYSYTGDQEADIMAYNYGPKQKLLIKTTQL